MSSDTLRSSAEKPGVIWARESEIVPFSSAPGVHVKPIVGQTLMTCWVTMDPGAVIARHSHVNEQLGVLIEGTVTVTVGDETRSLQAGDAYVVAADVPHEGVAGPEGAKLVETFVPVRDDFVRAWRTVAGE